MRFVSKTDIVNNTLIRWRVEKSLSFPSSLALFVASIMELQIKPAKNVKTPTQYAIIKLEPSKKANKVNKSPAIVIDLKSFGKRDLNITGLLSSGKSRKTVGATKADWNIIKPQTKPEIKTWADNITFDFYLF